MRDTGKAIDILTSSLTLFYIYCLIVSDEKYASMGIDTQRDII